MKPRSPRRVRRFITLGLIFLSCLAALIIVMASGARTRSKETGPAANKESAVYVNARGRSAPVPAGLITVNSTADTLANDGQCTLREAIINANDDAATWGDCAAGSGTDTIVLAASAAYPLTDVDNGSNGLPLITSAVIIQGNGSTIQRSGGAPRFRIFEVAAAAELTLDHLTVSGGLTANGANGVVGVNFGNGGNGGDGGGIYNSGTLTLINTVVSGNATGNGGNGIDGSTGSPGGNGGFGGGIYNTGTLTLTNSTVSNNKAGDGGAGGGSSTAPFGALGGRGGRGGGIYHGGGTLNINGSAISNNTAGTGSFGGAACNGCTGGPGGDGGTGGGIHINGGTVTLTHSQLNDNRAGNSGDGGSAGHAGGSGFGGPGGAISNQAGTLSITNCTLNHNQAGDAGASSFGVVDAPGGFGGHGGAIYNQATLNLRSSTVSNNGAGKGGRGSTGAFNGGVVHGGQGGGGGKGGGLYNDKNATSNLANNTIGNNSAGVGGNGGDCIGGNGSNCLGGNGGFGGDGGGIDNAGVLILINTTISHNSNAAGGQLGNPHTAGLVGTPGRGGGIYEESGAGFPSASAKIRNTIIAKNIDVRESIPGAPITSPDVSGPFTSLGHNFIGQSDSSESSGLTDDPGCAALCDKVGTIASPKDPLLGPLADNGGPTLTRNLLPGSSAIDAGDNCVLNQSCTSDNPGFDLTTDQRGLLRPQQSTVDIGAVEAVNGVPDAPDLLPASDSGSSQTDNLTNATNLQFQVTGAGAGATVVLLRDETLVATATADSNGTAMLSYTDNSADGTYNFTSRLSISGAYGAESAPLLVTIDRTRGSVTIDQAGGQLDPTASLPINFTVVFSEPVTGFTNTDVSLAGSTANVSAATINVTGGGTTYNVAVGNVTSDGTVQATVSESAAFDAAGNGNTASTSSDNTVTRDTAPPTVTVNQAAGQSDPTNSFPINFTVVFNEPVTGFNESDILLTGSTANVSVATINVTGSGTTYNVAVGNIIGSGTVRVSIPAGAGVDAAGLASAASTSTDNTVTYNLPPPSVTINQAAGQLDPTASLPINFTVIFSEPVTGFTNTDVSLAGSTANVSAATINVTGGGTTYNVAVGNVTSDGTVQASIPANVAANVENVLNTASTSTDNIVTRDTTPTILTVNTLGDAGDNVCDATCTLRDAIITAASPPGPKHIKFNLPSCTTASPCTITLTRGELTIPSSSPISIFGLGANVLTISGNNQSRLFVLNNAGLDLSDLKLTGGRAGDGSPDGAGGDGGAIYSNNGTLTLTNIILSGNNAGNGGNGSDIQFTTDAGHPGGRGGHGGAIYNNGTLTLVNTAVSGNSAGAGGKGGFHFCCPQGAGGAGGAGGDGGGIYSTGTLTLINSTVSNNNAGPGGVGEASFSSSIPTPPGGAGGNGGGIYTTGPTNITGSTFNNNNAGPGGTANVGLGPGGPGGQGGQGGAIYNNGALVMTNTTLSSNNTGQGAKGGDCGGGGSIPGGVGGNGGNGGAIYNNTGTTNLTNLTVTNNSTRGGGSGGCGNAGCASGGNAGNGGGIANAGGTVSARNSIIAGNNPAPGGSGPDLSGAFASLGHNFIGKNDGSTGFTNGSLGDQVGTSASPKDPLLGSLQDNGGPTQTILPAGNSGAIDAGDNCVTQASHCGDINLSQLTTDQRGTGFPRNVEAKGTAVVDIGAVESDFIEDITDKTTPKNTPLSFSFRVGDLQVANISGVTATSGNQALVADSGLVVTGSGATRTLTITPVTNQTGTTTITVTVTRPGRTTTDTFVLTVTGTNNSNPSDISLSNASVPENSAIGSPVGTLSTTDPDPGDTFTYSLVSGTGDDDNGSFTISVDQLKTAAVFDFETKSVYHIRVRTTDSGGLFVEKAFTISVTDVNEAPTAVADSYSTDEDTALNVNAPGVLSNDTGISLAASLVADVSHGALTLNADGSFSYTPASNFNGADSFTYKASNGSLSSNAVTVTITINAVNDAPSFTKGPDQSVSFNPGAQTVPNWATSISTGPANESGQTLTFLVTNDNNTLFSAQPAIDSTGTLTYTPASNASGTATVTVKLKDNGGTANGGHDTSPEQTFTITVKGQAQINFSNLIQTYDGTPKAVSATTVPAGLTVVITYDGSPTPPTNVKHDGGGNVIGYAVAATVQDNSYEGTANATLTINKANQTITFGPLTNKTYGDAPFTVSATASSGLAVSFAATGNCTVTGNSVHITGAGSCTITASRSGDSNYNAAPDVSQSFNIAKATPVITWNNPADIMWGTALNGTQLNATANVPGSFVYTPADGTVLGYGNGQNLHANFTPVDTSNYANASKDVSINVLSAVLTTAMIADRNPALVGYNHNYKVSITNTGTAPATNVTLTDTLPAQVSFTAVTSSQGSCAYAPLTRTVTCNLGTLGTTATANVQITVKPQQTGTLDNTATVTSGQWDPATGNSSVSVNGLQSVAQVDVSISKADSADPINVGDTTTYTLTVKNGSGPINATGVVATDNLPASMTFVSATTSQGSLVTPPAGSTGIVTANIGTMAPNSTVTVTITVTGTQAGAITNTATVSENETDSVPANNTSSQTTTVKNPPPPVTLQKVLLGVQTLTGGCGNTTGNAYLTAPAPVGGVTVNLSSNISGASVTASVFIPFGQSVSPAFTVTSSVVPAKQVGLITATLGAQSVSRGITINKGSGSCP